MSLSLEVQGGDGEGQEGVDDSQGHTENSQESSADVLPLEEHQRPVENTFSSQAPQDGGDGDVHCVFKEALLLWMYYLCDTGHQMLHAALFLRLCSLSEVIKYPASMQLYVEGVVKERETGLAHRSGQSCSLFFIVEDVWHSTRGLLSCTCLKYFVMVFTKKLIF